MKKEEEDGERIYAVRAACVCVHERNSLSLSVTLNCCTEHPTTSNSMRRSACVRLCGERHSAAFGVQLSRRLHESIHVSGTLLSCPCFLSLDGKYIQEVMSERKREWKEGRRCATPYIRTPNSSDVYATQLHGY